MAREVLGKDREEEVGRLTTTLQLSFGIKLNPKVCIIADVYNPDNFIYLVGYCTMPSPHHWSFYFFLKVQSAVYTKHRGLGNYFICHSCTHGNNGTSGGEAWFLYSWKRMGTLGQVEVKPARSSPRRSSKVDSKSFITPVSHWPMQKTTCCECELL